MTDFDKELAARNKEIEAQRQALRQDLENLGATAEEVAATLAKDGCKGQRRQAWNCPVSDHLARIGWSFPSALETHCSVTNPQGAGRILVTNPEPVRQFVADFDQGRHPHLEGRGAA